MLPFDGVLERIRHYFPERRAAARSGTGYWTAEFLPGIPLDFRADADPPTVALKIPIRIGAGSGEETQTQGQAKKQPTAVWMVLGRTSKNKNLEGAEVSIYRPRLEERARAEKARALSILL